MKKVELLMPAGSLSKMKITLAYGADAVYLGPPLYSLRARENDFHLEELSQAIHYVHSENKKVYMTLNIFARNRKLKPLSSDIQEYEKLKPDAFIISDPGLALIAKEMAPSVPIHLSVQANCMNWKSVKFWQDSLGIERVILSRELSINEIQEMKQRVPDVELEAFIHGSICIAYSGRCLLSSYMDKRDANQGVCDNSCREKYNVYTHPQEDVFIQETRSDEKDKFYQIDEDEHGTYILNAKDLCMIEHLEKLRDAGVVSFKVEGRTKSEFYAAMVARSYRHALDDLEAGRAFNPYWLEELHKLSHRGYHTGFMLQEPKSEGQNYKTSTLYNEKIKSLGLVKCVQGDHWVEIKNKISIDQEVDMVLPSGEVYRDRVLGIFNQKQEEKKEVHSGSGLFKINFASQRAMKEHSMIISHV